MTTAGVCSTRPGSSALKIHLSMTCTGESDSIWDSYTIDNLAKVKFKVNAKLLEDKIKFSVSFSSSKHQLAKDKSVKINVQSKTLKYSALNIDVPNNGWSTWRQMGLNEAYEDDNLYYTTVSILVTAYECKKEMLLSKLYTDNDFTDFHLATSDGSVPVHKACLAAHSDAFKAMLNNEWKETINGEVTMKGVTLETLQHLKEYMYLGTVPDDGLCPLLLIARCYLIKDLEEHCIRKLAENVTGENLFSLLEFACDNNIAELSFALVVMTEDEDVHKAKLAKDKQTAIMNSLKQQ